MRLEFADTEDVLSGTDNVAKNRYGEDGAAANKPNEYIESQLLLPCLLHIQLLHPSQVCKEWIWHP